MAALSRLASVVGMLLASASLGASPPPKQTPRAPSTEKPYCSGEYADDLAALTVAARTLEQHHPPYTFCVRASATYECPYYGQDGSLRRVRRQVTAHGTAFAYKKLNGETYLLTNQHVAEWPLVTEADKGVEDVPVGCKRVAESVRIVDKQEDRYERDDLPLTYVVSDSQLDVAILKSSTELPVLPWKIGRNASLRERNVVDVRGFPLGVFKATNVGKVISAYDHDLYRDWDHDDFVVDALLSPGNSGSPVFAVSCKTGEFELVGIYHADYSRGRALNVVVGIDQVRDLMTKHKRLPRPKSDPAGGSLSAASRKVIEDAATQSVEPYFPFGTLTAAVRVRSDGALLFEVLSREFPFQTHPWLVLEDLPSKKGTKFGSLARIWVGNQNGLKLYERSKLEAETQAQLVKTLDSLRKQALSAFNFRSEACGATNCTRERFERAQRLETTLRRATASRQEWVSLVGDLAERLGPSGTESGMSLTEVLSASPPDSGEAELADELDDRDSTVVSSSDSPR